MTADPAYRLWQLSDLSLPWALRVVSTLGVADLIADGVRKPGELARRTSVDTGALSRVLACCAAHGVLRRDGDEYDLTDLGECLRAGHPSRMSTWLRTDGAADRMDRVFAELATSVRTGRAAYAEIHGRPFYDDLQADPALSDSFDALMAADAVDYGAIVPHLDTAGGVVVDVGGGSGELLAEVLRRDAEATAALLELPATARVAQAHLAEFGTRARIVEGSFLDGVQPTGADLYVLAAVLHNWPDDDAVTILRNVRAAAGPDSRVVVVDAVVTPEDDQRWSAYLDLKMLVLLGGAERTIEGYRELGERAGLRYVGSTVVPRGPFASPSGVLTFVPVD